MAYVLDALNELDRESFTRALGWVCEHSPWVVDRAWECRPFTSLDELHAALVDVIRRAPREEQLELLRAHPELAADRVTLTEASAREQAEAGLTRLDAGQAARFVQLNRRYRDRFGFPFIIAVRGLGPDQILAALERRLVREPEEEFLAGLNQLARIIRLRLEEAVDS